MGVECQQTVGYWPEAMRELIQSLIRSRERGSLDGALPLLSVPSLPQIREYANPAQAEELLKDPQVQAVYRRIDMTPFAEALRDYTSKRQLLVPDTPSGSDYFRSLLAPPPILADAIRLGLVRTGFPEGTELSAFVQVLQQCSAELAAVAGVSQIWGHASVRDRRMIDAIATERQLQDLSHIELPLYAMWNPVVSKLVSPEESGVNRPLLHQLQRDRRNREWKSAVDVAPWYLIPENTFVIAKGARTSSNLDPGQTGATFACGNPWLFRYLPLEKSERTFHIRWIVTEVPPFFRSPMHGTEF